MTVVGCRRVPDVTRNSKTGSASNAAMAKPATPLHWPEYLIEAGAIGTFMVSAAVFAAVLYHPVVARLPERFRMSSSAAP